MEKAQRYVQLFKIIFIMSDRNKIDFIICLKQLAF